MNLKFVNILSIILLSSCSFNLEGVHTKLGDTHIKLTSEFLPFTKIQKSDIRSTKDSSESRKLNIFAVSNQTASKAE